MLSFVAIGLDHTSAGIELREPRHNRAELPEANAVVRNEVQRFTSWLSRRDAAHRG